MVRAGGGRRPTIGGTSQPTSSAACPTCASEVDPGARFCASCGTTLVAPCPACGAETRVGARFCAACGHRLDAPAAREEERKLVTVLFADLTGSTTLGERLDPERVRVLLADYFAAMANVIESRGGKVEKYVGDAIMAVFGIPAMHEDDAERALRAALEMQARLDELNPELAERHAVELAMRIGLATGEVLAGTGGDQFMVTGDAVNLAARLQQTAEPGEIVAAERTYRAAEGAFVFEPLEQKTLKGKSLPVAAWRVVEQADVARPRGVPGVSARLVGRERELDLLETLYRGATEDHRPTLVTILGQAGVGKTRLTEEFVARARAEGGGAAVYRGRCLAYGEGITYWALREILWSATGILLDDPGAVAADKLRTFVHALLDGSPLDTSDADRVTFALATSAGIALPDNPLDELSPESIGEELGLAWPRLVSELAARRPTLVIVEDLHWAEPPLLDMIEHLVSRSTGRLLVLTTARPEFAEMRPAWSSRPAMSQIALEPLGEEDAEQLVAELVPLAGADLRARVLSAAEGNPFFAEEIVRHLIDQGVLARDGNGLVEVDRDAVVTIPDTVRALVAARVDSLPGEHKRVLQDAAVVGRVFWATTLEAMRADGRIREALRALEERGLVVTRATSSLPGHIEVLFRHGLTREVAYESIPKARRARAHADVGRWIEQLAGERRDEYVELLAYHYEAAASPDNAALAWPDEPAAREEMRARAVTALIDAGHGAKTRFSIDQALGFGDRALALAANDAERLAALELKAEAAHAGIRADQAWSAYVDALALAERIGDRDAAPRLRARATLLWARYQGAFTGEGWKAPAVDIVERGLAAADEDSVTFETGALLTGRAVFSFWRMGRERTPEEARRDAERALEIAEAIDSPMLVSYAVDALAAVAGEQGYCDSEELAERALRASKEMSDRWGAHEMLVTAAIGFSDAGRFEEAVAVAEEGAREALRLSPHHRLHGAAAQTSALLPLGRLRELREATADAPALVAEEGMHTCFHGMTALAAQALAAFETQDAAAMERALEAFSAAQTPSETAHAYGPLIVLAPVLGTEELSARRPPARAAETTTAAVGRVRLDLQLEALTGRAGRFAEVAAEARALASRACAPYLEWIADWGEAVLLAAAGRSEEAVARVLPATAALERYGRRYEAARLVVDLLPFLDRDVARGLAADVAPLLEAMGALASAAAARAALDGPAAA